MSDLISIKKNIPIAVPCLSEDEWLALKEPLVSGWLTQGPKVVEFEKKFALMHNVKYSLAVTSCTTGLHLALLALGIGPGDEVIVPAFTWIATANVVEYCGATPVFCDVDVQNFNIKIEEIASKVNSRTKAVIAVHLFGLCADINAIRSALPSHIKIIEDAACAAGAQFKNQYAGSLGDIAVFSFHPRKSITTGEGGMITTNDPKLASQIEIMRSHGAEISEELRHKGSKPYLLPDFKILGYNYRMTDLQASIGIVQLLKLNAFIEEREKWASFYDVHLKNIPWIKPQQFNSNVVKHAWQAYVCYIDPVLAPMPRNDMMEVLQSKGISTRPGTHAVHMLGYYKDKYQIKEFDFPGAQACDQNTMAIPLHNKMLDEDYEYIVEALHRMG